MSSTEIDHWGPLLSPVSSISSELARWDCFEDATKLLHALEQSTQQAPPALLLELLPRMQAPPEDFLLSPISARVGALGVQAGCLFTQHELSLRVPAPASDDPETPMPEGIIRPTWNNGFLTEPRYFSFGGDAILQTYHPNHRRQWRPHEVLHALTGFFWSPRQTRFEVYLGARLNELLPVIHWYGWDLMYRSMLSPELTIRRYLKRFQAYEVCTTPYWKRPDPYQQRQEMEQQLWRTLKHWSTEWKAIQYELQTGRTRETPRGALNASSDAVGYLLGHWNRLTSFAFGQWVEQFLISGVDYAPTLEALTRHVHRLHQRLFTEDIRLDGVEQAVRQLRRRVLDAGKRLCQALNHYEPESQKFKRAYKAVSPLMESLARAGHALHHHPTAETMKEAQQQLQRLDEESGSWLKLFSADIVKALPCQGLRHHPLRPAQVHFLVEGLGSGMRCSDATQLRKVSPEQLYQFTESEYFQKGLPLLARWEQWLKQLLQPLDSQQHWRLQWDVWLQKAEGRDAEAERFSVMPEEDDKTQLHLEDIRLNKTAQQASFPLWLVNEQLGVPMQRREMLAAASTLQPALAFSFDGELKMMPLTMASLEILEAVRRRKHKRVFVSDIERQKWFTEHWDSLAELLEVGALIWQPLPSRAFAHTPPSSP